MAKIDDSVKKKVPELRFPGFTDDWEERKLRDLLNKNSEKNKNLSVINVESVSNKTGFTKQTDQFEDYSVASADLSNYYVIREKQFAYNPSRINVGSIAYKDLGDEISVVSPLYVSFSTKKILNDGFLWNWFKTASFDAQRQRLSAGGVRDTLSFNQLSEMNTMFPTYPEQQKIGSFFKQLDNTIALHQRKLDLLKEQKKGYLQKMFPKNGAKVPELRFAGFADAWEQRKLNEVSDIYDGTHQTPKYQDDGVMFLSVENIKTLTSNKFISREAFEDEFKIRPQRGDVLMTRIGDIGTANVVETDEDLAYYVSLALFKSEELNPYFLQASIYAPFVQDQIWKRTLHIAFPKKINKNEIGQVPINVPTLAEQTKIGSFFKQLDNTITLHQRKLDLLKEQTKGFLQKMFV